jgi:hypothetical protein
MTAKKRHQTTIVRLTVQNEQTNNAHQYRICHFSDEIITDIILALLLPLYITEYFQWK